ncbi:hypothetical protein DICA2_F03928 [Diutina catenulata]
MNYDPIHDTYVDANDQASSSPPKPKLPSVQPLPPMGYVYNGGAAPGSGAPAPGQAPPAPPAHMVYQSAMPYVYQGVPGQMMAMGMAPQGGQPAQPAQPGQPGQLNQSQASPAQGGQSPGQPVMAQSGPIPPGQSPGQPVNGATTTPGAPTPGATPGAAGATPGAPSATPAPTPGTAPGAPGAPGHQPPGHTHQPPGQQPGQPSVQPVQPPNHAATTHAATTHTATHATASDSDPSEDDSRRKRKYYNSTVPKSRHLKKADGEPFWRKDIQYDFLAAVFADPTACFSNYFAQTDIPMANNAPRVSFAELYIRTIAESSKCSKVLKERLLRDRDMGESVAKVTLLVNAGRMNTTINFVPEMRSTLRTYHSIPSLQADAEGRTKPLQDTPRLKSILKAVCESDLGGRGSVGDGGGSPTGGAGAAGAGAASPAAAGAASPSGGASGGAASPTGAGATSPPGAASPTAPSSASSAAPRTLAELIEHPSAPARAPNTNVFSLIFLLSAQAPPIPFYDDDTSDFLDFFLNSTVDPANRARRFLWLMYTYLETDFSAASMAQNPFGGATIPPRVAVPGGDQHRHDVDTPVEVEYSQMMFRQRLHHLGEDAARPLPRPPGPGGDEPSAEAQAAQAAAAASAATQAHHSALMPSAPMVLEEEPHRKRTKYQAANGGGPVYGTESMLFTNGSSPGAAVAAVAVPPGAAAGGVPPVAGVPGAVPGAVHDDTEADDDDDAPVAGEDPDFEMDPGLSSPVPSPGDPQVEAAKVEPKKKAVKKKAVKEAPEETHVFDAAALAAAAPAHPMAFSPSVAPYAEAQRDLALFLEHQARGSDGEGARGVPPVGADALATAVQLEHIHPDHLLTNRQHHELVQSTKNFIKEVRTSSKASTASFNKKTTILGGWIYRYFKYKRSIGNRFLGIEWEDIRYDLVHGIEDLVYAEFGHGLHQTPTEVAEEGQAAKEEGIVAQHDYNRINERNMFVLQLVSFVNDWFITNMEKKGVGHGPSISFDLSGGEVVYS